ncbi:MAG TPA: hypothetical protein PKD86_18540 [Gemmatales bacterium]|nr:hypothetical protein [Gemmatales bacterium]HMP61344.1 hypothetical protein [Gemmatales bacterium]
MSQELNVLALVKGRERYVFVYDDASHRGLIAALHAWAAHPHLSFSWFDAAVLAERSQQQLLAAAAAAEQDPLARRQQAGLPEAD